MRIIFGIEVRKATSEVAILVNGERVHGDSISLDILGFSRIFHDLTPVVNPEIIFEATRVDCRRLEAFLKNDNSTYTSLNPLETKKNR